MKVNQIVNEHKKGVRAHIYTKKATTKAQGSVPLYGPDKQEAKMTPYKAPKAKPVMEVDAKITKSDQSGVEITAGDGVKTTLPPDKASALAPDPQNPNEYDLNPAVTNPSASGTGEPTTPKVGASVEMKTQESGSDGLKTRPDRLNTFPVSLQGSTPSALMGGRGPQPITSSSKWTTLTPEIEDKLATQSFSVVYLKVNDKLIPAASGGGKLYVGSQDYPLLTAGSAMRESRERKTQDDILLDKMLTIAGLR